ncbi:CPBP family intramembrane glutamic endopeptidase [Brevibacterium aurantiacum]|uniref:CPBP family intramembrane metalloprotease n=1 Tax=Brevibacterium aurantiacum TaxID=273384 RepID=A0A2A3Z2Y6_BREAU|nr:type II CAAX endopeptidase family protein [Brevibacterium aurantiacum]PCC45853.1 CPBP family intramembrane metalloprotease [Brevibacterium aurantiacum]
MSSSQFDLVRPATTTKPLTRPGWPEIAAGIGVALALLMLTPLVIVVVPDGDPQLLGLALMCWSVVVPFAGFAAAVLIRIRSWGAFGIRRTTWRWMLAAVGLGIGAFLIKGVVNMAVIAIVGVDANAQVPYYEAADSGMLLLIATVVTISLLVPLGEELLFRGVLMRGLLRYGAVIAVVGSSVVFALFHGVNMALPSALVVGVVAAEVVRRSGSVWPAVVIHVINNLAAPVFVLLGGATAA